MSSMYDRWRDTKFTIIKKPRDNSNETVDAPLLGCHSEPIEVSRDAARRSGEKINAWISKALQKAAENHEK